jgi:hypothetical protein
MPMEGAHLNMKNHHIKPLHAKIKAIIQRKQSVRNQIIVVDKKNIIIEMKINKIMRRKWRIITMKSQLEPMLKSPRKVKRRLMPDMKNIMRNTRKRRMFRVQNKILINILKATLMIANITAQKIMVNHPHRHKDIQLATNLVIAIQIRIVAVKDYLNLKKRRSSLARSMTTIIRRIIIKSTLVLNNKNLRLKHMVLKLPQSHMMTTIMESNIIKKVIRKGKIISTTTIITTIMNMAVRPNQVKKEVLSIDKGLERMRDLDKRYLIKQRSSLPKWS